MVRGRQKASKKETGPLPWRATPASEGKQVLAWAGRGAVPLSGRPPPAAGRPLRDVRLLARSPPLEAGWVKAGITVLRGVLAKGGFCLGRVACFVCMHGPVCLSVCHYPEWGTVRGAPGARNACITAARSCGRFFRIEVRDGASSGVFWAWAWAASGARGHIHKIAAGVARSWRRQRCCAALRCAARRGTRGPHGRAEFKGSTMGLRGSPLAGRELPRPPQGQGKGAVSAQGRPRLRVQGPGREGTERWPAAGGRGRRT
jgi:hypothetical protein